MNIKIQLCGGIIPVKAHKDDACFDLFVPKETVLRLGRQIVPLDFKVQVPKGWCAYVRSRSGFSSKGLTVYLSCDKKKEHPARLDADVITGIVDCGFTGIVGVILNCRDRIIDGDEWVTKTIQSAFNRKEGEEVVWDGNVVIKSGERIAQMAVLPVPDVAFEIVDKVEDSERGEGGFGSTNKEGGES